MRPAPLSPVIVGVDGSASSMSAVRAAAGFASLYDLPLQVVHAFNWLPRSPDDADLGATAHGLVEQAVTVARHEFPHLSVGARLLEGAPDSTLLRQAHTAALVAVGDGGLPAHVCLPTYTSAVHVAARASCSVLVARATHPAGGSIVVGVNGSPAAERALDFAFDLAARSGADLVVASAEAGDRLGHLAGLVAARENEHHIAARIRILPGDPADALVAESEQARLVVAGARGRQRYGGLLGSAAQALLHHGHAPLVLVRNLIAPRPERSGAELAAAV